MPFFSVVLITYNRADLLPRCIDSVINQTFDDWELIIVDNYSEDGTKELIENYMEKDNRIKFIQVHNNNVLAVSRNAGIKMSQGKYIGILDSDDWYHKEKLKVVYDVCVDKEYDVLYNRYKFMTSKGEGRTSGKALASDDVFYELLMNGPIISNTTTVVKKTSIEKVGYLSEDPSLRAVEDLDLWLRMANNGCTFHFINKCLGYYWLGDNMSYSLKQLTQIDNIYQKFLPEIEPERLPSCISCHDFLSARTCHKIGEFDKAIKFYKNSMKAGSLNHRMYALILILMSKIGVRI